MKAPAARLRLGPIELGGESNHLLNQQLLVFPVQFHPGKSISRTLASRAFDEQTTLLDVRKWRMIVTARNKLTERGLITEKIYGALQTVITSGCEFSDGHKEFRL